MKKSIKVLAMLLVVLTLSFAVACAPNADPEKAKASLEENGYAVLLATDAISLGVKELGFGLEHGDLVATLTAVNEDGEAITILYFAKSGKAKDFYKDNKDNLKKLTETDDSEKEVVAKQSGKMIYVGTKAAIKAA
ncbi:MAG: hypothetical protein IKC33_01120 [Clostridia bacterium]|nr:hypothetical protein [Clostridia bacterium]MBQ6883635.1 hypothetical protein [Clostridia bacterium]MBR2932894.1 hypothetical protein [Clostridia bacterium]